MPASSRRSLQKRRNQPLANPPKSREPPFKEKLPSGSNCKPSPQVPRVMSNKPPVRTRQSSQTRIRESSPSPGRTGPASEAALSRDSSLEGSKRLSIASSRKASAQRASQSWTDSARSKPNQSASSFVPITRGTKPWNSFLSEKYSCCGTEAIYMRSGSSMPRMPVAFRRTEARVSISTRRVFSNTASSSLRMGVSW